MIATPEVVTSSTLHAMLEAEFAKEVWDLKKLAISVNPYIGGKTFGFKRIEPAWLKEIAKRFIRYHAASKAFETLCQYKTSITRFSHFLNTLNRPTQPEDIGRPLLMQFIAYLQTLKLGNASKNKTLGHIESFLMIAGREGWANMSREKMIYGEDRLPTVYAKPRYIPDTVLDQLNRHLSELPEDVRRLVTVLQHTGRRIGELCTLFMDCLLQDEESDYFLRYYEFKMKKEQTIPISLETANCIKEQQQWVKGQLSIPPLYLFSLSHTKAMPSHTVRKALNDLAKRHGISGPDGALWRFQPHQFRHTVGTKMINQGVPAHIVQRYLHHRSPKMTMTYAHIHDHTLKTEFTKFQGKIISITGKILNKKAAPLSSELRWLKRNVMAQALPNGYCGLPVTQQGCPHANACLTCSSFRTEEQFLPLHERQLEETQRLIEVAQQNGWVRQIELNQKVKTNLETIITTLRDE